MIVRFGAAALATMLVLGCTSTRPPEQQWTKKGATLEDVKRDLYWCTGDVTRPMGALETPASGRIRTERKVDDECMENRGYTKGAPKG